MGRLDIKITFLKMGGLDIKITFLEMRRVDIKIRSTILQMEGLVTKKLLIILQMGGGLDIKYDQQFCRWVDLIQKTIVNSSLVNSSLCQ